MVTTRAGRHKARPDTNMRRVTYQPTPQEYYNPQQYGENQSRSRRTTRPGFNPRMAVNLEYLGYIGLLGIGHMYAGFVGRGFVLLISWLIIAEVLFLSIVRGP